MYDHMRAALSAPCPGLIVWVTHDTILSTLASRLLPRPLTLADWPDFLGALDVFIDRDGELQLSYESAFHLS